MQSAVLCIFDVLCPLGITSSNTRLKITVYHDSINAETHQNSYYFFFIVNIFSPNLELNKDTHVEQVKSNVQWNGELEGNGIS